MLPTPPLTRGAAIAIPSGTLCTAIMSAISAPISVPSEPDAPIAIPSGKLCRAIAISITVPALSIDLR